MKSIFFISNNKERVLRDDIGAKVCNRLDSKLKYFSIYPEKFNLNQKLSTYQLLRHPKIISFIKDKTEQGKTNILVFKNSRLIEQICSKHGYNLLCSPAKITSYLENKISQAEFLHEYDIPRPVTIWGTFEDVDFYKVALKLKLPFILQFGLGHSGQGSVIIKDQDQFRKLCEKYPRREIRCSEWSKGEAGTINLCITGKGVIYGAPSLQITGVKGLTNNPLSTVGNDWAYIKHLFKKNNLELKFIRTVEKLNKALKKIDYKGILGIDFIINQRDKRYPIKIIEINARFPVSTVNETELAIECRNPVLLEYHIRLFLKSLTNKGKKDIPKDYIPYYNRARLLTRDHQDKKEVAYKIFKGSVYLGNNKVKKETLKELKRMAGSNTN